jgi:hypothetical protein
MRMTEKQLAKLTGQTIRHKFNAQPVEVDGHHFPSTVEAQYKDHLDWLIKCGEVLFYLRQVPFHLPHREKYIVDYVVFYTSGTVSVLDIKGAITREFLRKKKLVETYYPVQIKIVKMKKGRFFYDE